MSVSLQSTRDYTTSLTWIEGGNFTADVVSVLDFLSSENDSSWFVAESRRAVVVVQFWKSRLRYIKSRLQMESDVRRLTLDREARDRLVTSGVQVRTRYVNAAVLEDSGFSYMADTIHQYECALGLLEGIEAALDTALVVQEAVAIRRQEEQDSLTA